MYGQMSLPPGTMARRTVFGPLATAVGVGWVGYDIPPGATMLDILCIAPGGDGGDGVVGAASTAAGGGGGGSGGQTHVVIPASLLPRRIFVSVPAGTGTSGFACQVCIWPENIANYRIAFANGGSAGGNAAGAVAGAAGGAGGVATAANMPLGFLGIVTALAGQAGIIGGTTVAGAALTLPVTGLVVTGGTGGGGLPAAATAGTNGGAFIVPGIFFPPQPGGIGALLATDPGGRGSNGFNGVNGLFYNYGGTGGGSSHGTAITTGLFGGIGGQGGIGSGGGGGGGALTGSVQGTGGRGGDGCVIITAW